MITEHHYDDRGNRLRTVEAKGTDLERTHRFTYDEYGQLLSAAFGESIANTAAIATEHYGSDLRRSLTQYTDPLGHTTQFAAFDALGNAHTITDARGQRWQRRFTLMQPVVYCLMILHWGRA